MGYVFEDLVRRFNEQANEEAGDHFTPREVIKRMVTLLFTYDDLVYTEGKVIKIYDPTAGTGGMLSESEKLVVNPETGLNPSANLELFGQEYNPESYAICGSDLMIKGEDVRNIIYGNTLGTGKAKEGFTDGDGHPNEKFHYMPANPPFGVEWKPENDHVTREHNEFGFNGRFGPGLPRITAGALLFLLHMISKMAPTPKDGGEGLRIGIVFNGSPSSPGMRVAARATSAAGSLRTTCWKSSSACPTSSSTTLAYPPTSGLSLTGSASSVAVRCSSSTAPTLRGR